MPQPAVPQRGYRNCSRCTRWRPVWQFPVGRTKRRDGTPIDPPQLSSWCEACRRADARRRARERYAAKRRRHRRALTLVSKGDALWAGPLQDWIRARRGEGLEWSQLAEWAGCDEKTLRRIVGSGTMTVSVAIADRLLVSAGWHLDDVYPWDEPDRGRPSLGSRPLAVAA